MLELVGVSAESMKEVRFFVNRASGEGEDAPEPVHVAKAAPYIVGVEDDGTPKAWTFEPGEVEVVAEIIPTGEDGEMVTVAESGAAMDIGAVKVRGRCHTHFVKCPICVSCPCFLPDSRLCPRDSERKSAELSVVLM